MNASTQTDLKKQSKPTSIGQVRPQGVVSHGRMLSTFQSLSKQSRPSVRVFSPLCFQMKARQTSSLQVKLMMMKALVFLILLNTIFAFQMFRELLYSPYKNAYCSELATCMLPGYFVLHGKQVKMVSVIRRWWITDLIVNMLASSSFSLIPQRGICPMDCLS